MSENLHKDELVTWHYDPHNRKPIPDGYEAITWVLADGEEARDALIARITPDSRVGASWETDEAVIVLRDQTLDPTRRSRPSLRYAGVSYLLCEAESIVAVVPVAEPAWVTCKAVMDRDGQILSRSPEGWWVNNWGHEFPIEGIAGPIRPLVDEHGTKVLDEGEIDALAIEITRQCWNISPRDSDDKVRTWKTYDSIVDILSRRHGVG